MKLRTLLRGLPVEEIKGSKDIEITGLSINSKTVAPGNLFIALRGDEYDGSDFIPEALAGGATAVLVDMYNPFIRKGVTQIIVKEVRAILGALCAKYYDDPSAKLHLVGVTGTNGKTTTTYLVKHIFEQEGIATGLMGTIAYLIGNYRCSASRTTPDVVTTHKLLKDMLSQGCQAAVMEVSSHALAQQRVRHVHFDVGVFTNISSEHLDYHGGMEAYREAKQLLFSRDKELSGESLPPLKVAVINADEKWVPKVDPATEVLTYGFSKKADLRAELIEGRPDRSRFKVSYKGQKAEVSWSFIGEFNILNGLASIACALIKGIPLERACHHLGSAPPVPGRLEYVENPQGIHVFVDYAHTDDALKQVLLCLQKVKTKRLITVFGCGGGRDTEKRPRMGKVAETYSDKVFITSDNPRMEDPEKILNDIEAGMAASSLRERIVDRAQAIQKALQEAKEGDIVLIAGKGHEKYQIQGHQTIPFDDIAVCKEVLEGIFL